MTAELMRQTGNQQAKFMHCLLAFHNTETGIGAENMEKYWIDCAEVTEDVFESKALFVFDRAENRMHMIIAVLVATIESWHHARRHRPRGSWPVD